MSNRNQEEVRKLAEEIAGAIEDAYLNPRGDLLPGDDNPEEDIGWWFDHLTAFLAEREAALQAQLHRALGELAKLRGAAGELLDYALQLELAIHGESEDAEESHAVSRARAALASTPLAERAGEVLGAAREVRRLVRLERQGPEDHLLPAMTKKLQVALWGLMTTVDALRAELAKGGEGG